MSPLRTEIDDVDTRAGKRAAGGPGTAVGADGRTTPIGRRPPSDAEPALPDAAPIGTGALAVTLFVFSCVNVGLVKDPVTSIVSGVALFGGAAQVLAGLAELRRGSTLRACTFTSLGAFWFCFWGLSHFFTPARGATAHDANVAISVFVTAWAILACLLTVAAIRADAVTLATLGGVTATLALVALAGVVGDPRMTTLAGWIGLLTAGCAWYATLAGVVNATWGRAVVPVWPFQP